MRTTADNYVAISIKAQDGAKPDLTELKARLDELKDKVATARADVDDADADAKLADLQARLDAVSKKVASPRIDMAGASRAVAQIAAVESAMNHLSDQSGKAGDQSGQAFVTRFGSWLRPGKFQLVTAGLTSALAALPGVAGIAGTGMGVAMLGGMVDVIAKGAYSQVSGALKAFDTAQSTTGKAAATAMKQYQAQMAALTPVQRQFAKSLEGVQGAWQNFINSNTSGVQKILSQGMGLLPKVLNGMSGIFKTLVPQFGSIFKNLGGVVDGLMGVMKAAAPAFGPFVNAILSLVKGILPGLQAIIRATVPVISVFGSIMARMGAQVGQMFSAMAPAVSAGMKVFGALAGVIGGLLPVIGHLAASLASALAPVLASFGKALVALTPAITVVGKVLGELAGAVLSSLAGALQAVARLLQGVAPAFGVLAQALGAVFTAMENTGVFGVLENLLENIAGPLGKMIGLLVSGLAPVLAQLVGAIMKVSGALLSGLSQAVIQLMPSLLQLVQALVRLTVQVVTPLLGPLTQLALALVKILLATLPLLPPLTKLIAVLVTLSAKVLVPVARLIAVVAGWLAKFADAVAVVIGWIAKIIGWGVNWIASNQRIQRAIADVFNWVRGHWPLLLAILAGPVGVAAYLIIGHWHQILAGTQRMASAVVSWFARLPGMILRAIGDLGSMLFQAGVNAIRGFISGAGSMIGSAVHTLEGWGHDLLSALGSPFGIHFSEPSEAATVIKAGQKIPLGLAAGMLGGTGTVRAAAARIAGAVALPYGAPGYGGYGPGGRGGAWKLQLEFVGGDDLLLRGLRNAIRVRGGNVQAVLGTGAG